MALDDDRTFGAPITAPAISTFRVEGFSVNAPDRVAIVNGVLINGSLRVPFFVQLVNGECRTTFSDARITPTVVNLANGFNQFIMTALLPSTTINGLRDAIVTYLQTNGLIP